MYYRYVKHNGVVNSLNICHHNIMLAPLADPNFPTFAPPLHHYNCVRVQPNAFPQHMKVLKHFMYMYFACVMQSGVVYSLNNNTTMSF